MGDQGKPQKPVFDKISIWLGNVDTKDGYSTRRPATKEDVQAELAQKVGDLIEERVETHLSGKRVCAVGIPASEVPNAYLNVTSVPRGLWHHQSFAPPAWVVSTDERLEIILAAHYGCPRGVPSDIDQWIGGDQVPRRRTA